MKSVIPYRLSIGLFSILALLVCISPGCRKDNFLTDPEARLEFSTDTVLFDTLFSTVGSTTRLFKVYNRHSQSIRISELRLEQGNSSPYRINVDGQDGWLFNDLELAAGDSLFIFTEVTIDPGNASTPFVVEDRILFETNGNLQQVQLSAWGPDAYFHGGLGGIFVLA